VLQTKLGMAPFRAPRATNIQWGARGRLQARMSMSILLSVLKLPVSLSVTGTLQSASRNCSRADSTTSSHLALGIDHNSIAVLTVGTMPISQHLTRHLHHKQQPLLAPLTRPPPPPAAASKQTFTTVPLGIMVQPEIEQLARPPPLTPNKHTQSHLHAPTH
jgi:hypothetical protein